MNMKDLLKDKNKLLMVIPILLGILFIYVFFLHGSGQETQESSDNRTAETLLEPESRVAEKPPTKWKPISKTKGRNRNKPAFRKPHVSEVLTSILKCRTGKKNMTKRHLNVSEGCIKTRIQKSWKDTVEEKTDVFPGN